MCDKIGGKGIYKRLYAKTDALFVCAIFLIVFENIPRIRNLSIGVTFNI